MTRSRLLIISFSRIEADARVLKQVARLSRETEVHTVGYGDAPTGVSSHIRIPDEFPIWRYNRVKVVTRRYENAYWGNQAIDFARRALDGTRWDAILANDVDAVGLALTQNSTHGVHADLHEYAPRQKEDVLKWRVFVAPFIRWMCRRFVVKAESVTTVGQGIADEYRRVYGIRADVVTNAAPFVDLKPAEINGPLRLVHSGAALRDRNILAIVDAVDATTADVSLDLYLTPNDPGFLEEVRARVADSARSELHEPVPYAELSGVLNSHDLGVHMLPPVNFNNTWALPNKFFDYVQARLGVIIGPSPEMARLLRRHGVGAVADGFSSDDLRHVLDGLSADQVASWKRAADASAAELSSETQVEIWAEAIRALLSSPTGRSA